MACDDRVANLLRELKFDQATIDKFGAEEVDWDT